MTTRLYYDSDALTFTAAVIAHDGDPTRVVLDQTAFYPTSGGQPHDTGTLGGVAVVDVIDDDERIVHVLAAPLDLGPVEGQVDADRRHDHTVQHTAQHLLSALAADRLGWETASVHFGADRSLIEFDTAAASDDELAALEGWAAAAVAEGLPVTVGYEDAAMASGLRKPPAREGIIRVVTIEGLDRSACGGTHVTSTARLGSIWVRGSERIRGRIRVEYLAGQRVLAAARGAVARLERLAAAAGAAPAELEELIPRRLEALREAEVRLEALEHELATHEAARLVAAVPAQADGARWVVEARSSRSPAALRRLADAMRELPGAVFLATRTDPPTVLLAAHPDSGVVAGARLKEGLAAVGGRGGGSAVLAQGTVPESAALDRVVAALVPA
ncbi:MAG: DHHA1 domain-containing protein [Gemmatimonadales bacterium]